MQGLKCSAGTAPQCLALNPCVSFAPALTWALPCAWRCRGVTCHIGNVHFASLSRLQDFEFLKSFRVHWEFSFLSLFSFPFFSASQIQCELQDSFQVFLYFVRAEKSLRELVGFFLKPILFPRFLLLTAYMYRNAHFPQIPTKKFPRWRQIGVIHFRFFNYFLRWVAAAVVCFPIEMDIYILLYG